MQYSLTRAGQWFIVRKLGNLLSEKYDHEYKFTQYVKHFIQRVENEAGDEWEDTGAPENGHAWIEVSQYDTWDKRPHVIGIPAYLFEAHI